MTIIMWAMKLPIFRRGTDMFIRRHLSFFECITAAWRGRDGNLTPGSLTLDVFVSLTHPCDPSMLGVACAGQDLIRGSSL